MSIQFEVIAQIPGLPERLYHAWLDSAEHSAMTGSPAEVSNEVGTAFSAWDGYISGVNLALEPGRRIEQSWRTTEFTPDDEDSILEVIFEPDGEQTQITLRHSNLPAHGLQYQQGWVEAYFEPMQSYFRPAQG